MNATGQVLDGANAVIARLQAELEGTERRAEKNAADLVKAYAELAASHKREAAFEAELQRLRNVVGEVDVAIIDELLEGGQ